MTELIDKAEVVAEIKKYISNYKGILNKVDKSSDDWLDSTLMLESKTDVLQHILSFLNTLEVKEVDLDNELENLIEKEKAFITDNREVKYYNGDSFNHIYELEFIAKHFFELGLKAAKYKD